MNKLHMNNSTLRRRSRSRFRGLFLLPAVAGIGEGPLPPPPQDFALTDLSFMTRCWNGTFESRGEEGVIEERYTSPSQNVMLGTTRYLIGERTVQFELTTILLGDSGIVMTPYPRGRASDDGFTLTAVSAGEAIFEAPRHDFPKRIVYRGSSDTLIARIDDGVGGDRSSTWEMERVACD